MITARLIQMIEDHGKDISGMVVRQIRNDPRLPTVAGFSEHELRERCEDIARNLGAWLTRQGDPQLAEKFQAIGRTRFQQGVPLHELVHSYHIIRQKMVSFIREAELGDQVLNLYARHELVRATAAFFENLVYHVVYGYEKALCEAAGLPFKEPLQAKAQSA